MPIRNIWSLEPGECITAEKIMEELKDCEVYFPLHDVGVNLLVAKEQKHVGIQVKESHYYIGRTWRSGHVGHSWHQIRRKKLLKDKLDFYIFLTYLPLYGEYKVSSFENKFIIVPRKELEKRVEVKDAGKRNVYSFCFHFENNSAWDERVTTSLDNELTNYSKFLNAWDLLKKALE